MFTKTAQQFLLLSFGAGVHKGFTQNISKTGFKHSILHSLACLNRVKERTNTMKTNNITYRRVGDYNIPNLILPPEEANITLGKWGMLHKDYLLKNKKGFLTYYSFKVSYTNTVSR